MSEEPTVVEDSVELTVVVNVEEVELPVELELIIS
jgi:hypothetical protein